MSPIASYPVGFRPTPSQNASAFPILDLLPMIRNLKEPLPGPTIVQPNTRMVEAVRSHPAQEDSDRVSDGVGVGLGLAVAAGSPGFVLPCDVGVEPTSDPIASIAVGLTFDAFREVLLEAGDIYEIVASRRREVRVGVWALQERLESCVIVGGDCLAIECIS